MSTEALTKVADKQKWKDATGFKGFVYKNRYILLSFLVPFVIMLVAFGVAGVSPFGDKQILVTDLWHQYFPFLADYQDRLKSGESLFFCMTVGGGTNYFALASYYLASPMNFLSVFIPGDWLREFLMFSVVTKIALAGMFMAMFLRYAFKKNDYSLLMFSVCFALCSFFMGYYWNTIWLDTVALTPLVAMGTLALMREGKFKTFVISLALSVIANYYIGLFTCIFVALLYICCTICNWKGFKGFMISLGKMAGFSAMSLAITAFLMLPAFFALQNTHASSSTFPTTFAINMGSSNDFMGVLEAVRKVIANSLSFIMPNTKDTFRAPNIACGTICIVMSIMFLASKKIKLREKLVNVGLLVFFTFSFIIRQLDYIWHGFHFTNMIPYRFSYLFSFIMVVMAFRAFMVIDTVNYLDVALSALGTAVIILLSIGVPYVENYSVIGTACVAVVIAAMLFLYTKRIVPKQALAIVLIIISVGEACVAGFLGVKTTTVTGTTDYPRGEQNTENVIKYMDNFESGNEDLWRAEMTSTQTLNDGALNHYRGLSMFNSMANESTTIFFENFGLVGWQGGNRYNYAESSPVANLFMNIKYIISRDGNYRNTYSLNEIYSSGAVKLLKNNKYLPMGFMTKSDLVNWSYSETEDNYNPVEQQNSFFRLATGVNGDIYTPIQVINQSHTDYEQFPVNKTDYGHYTFSCKDSSVVPHLQWNYAIEESGQYYAYVLITGVDTATILQNGVQKGTSYSMKRPYIMALGEFSQGDTLSVSADLDGGASGSAQVYVAKFNEAVFEQGYNILSQHCLNATKSSDSSLEGTIDAGEGGLFYTSIPYEEGWSAYVDGKPAEITPIGGSMLAFEVPEGEHSIKLSYIPKGYIPGTIISLMGLAAFVLTIVLYRRHNKKMSALALETANANKYNKKKKKKK